jgi:uncharacterized protein (DUF1684 family)
MYIVIALVCMVMVQADYASEVTAFRNQKDLDFKTEGKSPFLTKKERKQFEALRYFAPDEQYKVPAQYIRVAQEDTIDFMTSSGKVKKYAKVATLSFTLQGQALTLPAYQGIELRKKPAYDKYLFVPFTDGTSGAESYGGGRYLDLEVPDGDTLTLDFNYAYNPYCAYTDGYSCPIPAAESRLAVDITAGEKVYY